MYLNIMSRLSPEASKWQSLESDLGLHNSRSGLSSVTLVPHLRAGSSSVPMDSGGAPCGYVVLAFLTPNSSVKLSSMWLLSLCPAFDCLGCGFESALLGIL